MLRATQTEPKNKYKLFGIELDNMPLVPYDDICKAQALPNKENRYELQNVRDKSKPYKPLIL